VLRKGMSGLQKEIAEQRAALDAQHDAARELGATIKSAFSVVAAVLRENQAAAAVAAAAAAR
jgi:hypothetical protein